MTGIIFRSELFAVGNGTGCRDTENYLTRLINQKCFEPYNVQYTIINETGASQYSVSPEARAEFPGLDPNHISACKYSITCFSYIYLAVLLNLNYCTH